MAAAFLIYLQAFMSCVLVAASASPQLHGTFRKTTLLSSRRTQPHRGSAVPLDTTVQDAVRKAIMDDLKDAGLLTNGNLLHAMAEIDKEIAKMHRNRRKYRYNSAVIREFDESVIHTAKSGNTRGYRNALARALFMHLTAGRLARKRINGRGRHVGNKIPAGQIVTGAKQYLQRIRKTIGEHDFNKLISFNGQVTLVFVIDTTGSMKDDITAAAAIAKEIVGQDRQEPVNFILSPFNDPETQPVIFRNENELDLAADDLTNLTVAGGMDCEEKAFEGMLQALYYSPIPGSTMYVFTDASAKDDTEDNIETVIAVAIDLSITVYFFARGNCGFAESLDSFRRVAETTGGHLFELDSSEQIKKLSEFVSDNLKDGATVAENKVKSTRRDESYIIAIDDTVAKMTVVISMQYNSTLRLLSPDGVATPVRDNIEKSIIFAVDRPTPGNWTLIIPHTAGRHEYFVKTLDNVSVDFEYYYFQLLDRDRTAHQPVSHPLLGRNASVMLTIPEVDQVDATSLRLRVMYKDGRDGGTYDLERFNSSRERFKATFPVQKGLYRLELSGLTKAGYPFTRLGRRYDMAKPFILLVLYAKKYNLPLGRTSRLILKIENLSDETEFSYTVYDSFNYAHLKGGQLRKTRGPKSIRLFNLDFTVPSLPPGHPQRAERLNHMNKVVVKAIGAKTGIISTLILDLLITEN